MLMKTLLSALALGALLFVGAPARAQSSQVRCESYEHQTNYCNIGRHGDVRILQRLSDAKCHEGSDWGVRGDQIWVTDGCRAVFEVEPAFERDYGHHGRRDHDDDDNRYSNGGGYGGGYRQHDRGWYDDRRDEYITCESTGYQRNYCEVGWHVRAKLFEQLSDTACVRGQNWLDTQNGVWVSGGCRAVFKIKN